jgi:hypothetical protein
MIIMEEISKIKQKISSANRRRSLLMSQVMNTGPFIAAQVYERYKKCGSKNCKCSRGELHGPFTWLYQNKKGGKLLSTSVPKEMAKEAGTLAETYKILLAKRKQIREIDDEINLLLNSMEQLLERDAAKYVTKEKRTERGSEKDKGSAPEGGD